MKKIVLLAMAVAAMAFTACNDDSTESPSYDVKNATTYTISNLDIQGHNRINLTNLPFDECVISITTKQIIAESSETLSYSYLKIGADGMSATLTISKSDLNTVLGWKEMAKLVDENGNRCSIFIYMTAVEDRYGALNEEITAKLIGTWQATEEWHDTSTGVRLYDEDIYDTNPNFQGNQEKIWHKLQFTKPADSGSDTWEQRISITENSTAYYAEDGMVEMKFKWGVYGNNLAVRDATTGAILDFLKIIDIGETNGVMSMKLEYNKDYRITQPEKRGGNGGYTVYKKY